MKILLGISGSVASIKTNNLVNSLKKSGHEVIIVCTQNSKHFFDENSINCEIKQDSDEWSSYQKRGDPVLHIELAKWADIFLIAPLSANTMAKISNGICDNLLPCVARAWRFDEKNSKNLQKISFVVAPAMNSFMFTHPITNVQIEILKSFSIHILPVVEKTLICGDKGIGAMLEVDDIVKFINSLQSSNN